MNIIMKNYNGGANLVPVESCLYQTRSLFLLGPIEHDKSNDLIKQILMLNIQDRETPITLYIDSPGGEIISGLAIHDMIMRSPAPIHTVCIGDAASMACVIFAAGAKRVMLENSRLMLHEPLISNRIGGNTSSIKALSEAMVKTRDQLSKILAEHCHRSIDEIIEASSYDHYFSLDEAVEFGLCDGAADFSEILKGDH